MKKRSFLNQKKISTKTKTTAAWQRCFPVTSRTVDQGWSQQRTFGTTDDNRPPNRILITGGLGQIGTELTRRLRGLYGHDKVIVTDVLKPSVEFRREGPFV